jgi:hypothetical protein
LVTHYKSGIQDDHITTAFHRKRDVVLSDCADTGRFILMGIRHHERFERLRLSSYSGGGHKSHHDTGELRISHLVIFFAFFFARLNGFGTALFGTDSTVLRAFLKRWYASGPSIISGGVFIVFL